MAGAQVQMVGSYLTLGKQQVAVSYISKKRTSNSKSRAFPLSSIKLHQLQGISADPKRRQNIP